MTHNLRMDPHEREGRGSADVSGPTDDGRGEERGARADRSGQAQDFDRILDLIPAEPEPPAAPRAWKWFRVSLLLAALLVVAGIAPRFRTEPVVQHVQASPPPVVAPTGKLKEIFDFARPATVAIETRCRNGPRGPLGVGTGFFISEDGQVLSAYHVVDASSSQPSCPVEYVAVTPEREEYPLELLGFDAYFDVALLQAKVSRAVPYLAVSTRPPAPGDSVVAIGNSRGDFLEGRTGRVTRLGVRAARVDFADDTIELTAPLAPGDSGGPVLNLRGEAIGVVSYISFNPGASESDTYLPPFLRGLQLPVDYASYAVPVTEGGTLLAALRNGERRDVPVIGLSWPPGFDSVYTPRTSPVDLGPRPGTIVAYVEESGPAALAGLLPMRQEPVLDAQGRQVSVRVHADVIVAVDGRPVQGIVDLLQAVRTRQIGDSVTLRVQRGNALYNVDLVLGARRSVFGEGQ